MRSEPSASLGSFFLRLPFPKALLLVMAMTIFPMLLPAQEAPLPVDRWNRAALEWLAYLRSGDFASAGAKVDPEVPEGVMGAAQLETIWGQLSAQLGELTSVAPGPVLEHDQYQLVDLPAAFGQQAVTLRVVLTQDLLVSGFFVRPPEPPAYESPSYVDPATYREVEVTVGSDPWALPAVLTLPEGDGPFPGVVLVHGSGPNDRDETIGGNRPFRDLAWGLATRGVAVLRYDKRTQVHGAAFPQDGGLEEEVVEDALAALALLRSREEVGEGRVFLLGHSLGGMLAPDIALRDGGLAGVVVMAAPLRPFGHVLRSQLEYVLSLQGEADAGARAQVEGLLAELAGYQGGDLAPEELLMGVRVSYWQEMEAVDPLAAALRLQIPILALQGGRDYQALPQDLELWAAGFQGDESFTGKLYPALSHLFTPGEGLATPEEYATEVKHVDPEVIEDLARWILEGRLHGGSASPRRPFS